MTLSRSLKARLFAAVSGIEDHELYAEAQSIVGRFERETVDPSLLVELVECIARRERTRASALRAHDENLSDKAEELRAQLGESVDGVCTDALAFSKRHGENYPPSLPPNPRALAIIYEMRTKGETLQAISDALNLGGFRTTRGAEWRPTQVSRTIERGSEGRGVKEKGPGSATFTDPGTTTANGKGTRVAIIAQLSD